MLLVALGTFMNSLDPQMQMLINLNGTKRSKIDGFK